MCIYLQINLITYFFIWFKNILIINIIWRCLRFLLLFFISEVSFGCSRAVGDCGSIRGWRASLGLLRFILWCVLGLHLSFLVLFRSSAYALATYWHNYIRPRQTTATILIYRIKPIPLRVQFNQFLQILPLNLTLFPIFSIN